MSQDSAPIPVSSLKPVDDCWNHIGFAGDRSCPELERLGHCTNCRVFILASRRLLERPLPAGYLTEWAAAVAQPKATPVQLTDSLVVFGLGSELMAVPTSTCEEISKARQIHTVPHLTDDVFLGLGSIRGQIQPCFALSAVLRLETDADPSGMWVAIRERGEIWVFAVDQVLSIQRVDRSILGEPPATLGSYHLSFTTGIFTWRGKRVNVLDTSLIVQELARRLG